MVLATVGIYSVIAYGVRQRVREIGIRLALGAPPGQVIRLVVIEGLKPTIIGVILGLVLTVVTTGVMRSLLFGVSQYDPATLIGVATLMILVGLLAAVVPAYRATRFDVVRTLRAE
jgi:ABC-type antimicrobial peptide transport system permease subunit